MPVNLTPSHAKQLLPVKGVRLGIAAAGIKKPGRKDLLVIALDASAKAAGIFTQNDFCAAPVVVAKDHLLNRKTDSSIRALVINTGNANAGTGEDGVLRARGACAEVAKLMGCNSREVLPFSTGVIMESLPLDKIVAGLPAAIGDLRPDNWMTAAEAIMTTDTVPKAISRQLLLGGKTVTITGIAKGSGMIHPNMATMLGYIATDASLDQPLLGEILRHAAENSFNCITVDGDTSTNDAFILVATGHAGNTTITDKASAEFALLRDVITEAAIYLAQAIVRDGEGATKFITVRVEGGETVEECKKAAYAIARSPLVKTAFFASDPNLGRILAAIGYAGLKNLDVNGLKLYLDDVLVAENGGRASSYREQDGQRIMEQAEIMVRVALNRGLESSTIWTCDLSYDYVKINADYRSELSHSRPGLLHSR